MIELIAIAVFLGIVLTIFILIVRSKYEMKEKCARLLSTLKREYEMKEKGPKLFLTLKRFALLSLYSHEHSDNPDKKDWVRYEYLDHREKLVIGSEEDYEEFKKYLKN